MARTAEDLSAEVLALREANNRLDNQRRAAMDELKEVRRELDWWRANFGWEK